MLFTIGLTAAALASAAFAQTVVQVGSSPSSPGGVFQYTPNNFNATNGTTITFRFSGAPGNHTVTQSTFSDPCDPRPGGFDSGWVFIPASPALSATPEWNLTITDDSKPIWFFCKQILPSSHCSSGMIGAINAPAKGNNTFAAFQANAEAFKGTPNQGEGGLVGIGASASAPVGPVPSGAQVYTAAPLSISGSGAAATVTAPAVTSHTSTPAPTKGSGASALSTSSLVAFLAVAVGFVLA
ncbi:hypothetical protein K443DRAFT_678487 [Laccaria amethystina LaAM-08-1]|uniref:Extracellular serine-rich protein n=1 Tax=Laccaria amethystina LaAM-08-1 TaxID=1095629 RepID=A0A0C9XIL5_9AGAR|nr:hypothetical protein K443DRAFT_678487 [Laccaria amethystina LaAM-08-1]